MYYNPGIITLVLDQKAERILESAVRVLLIDRASVIRESEIDILIFVQISTVSYPSELASISLRQAMST